VHHIGHGTLFGKTGIALRTGRNAAMYLQYYPRLQRIRPGEEADILIRISEAGCGRGADWP